MRQRVPAPGRKESGQWRDSDLLVHTLDIALWLNGPVVEVSAFTETFIKERQRQDNPVTMAKVEIVDTS